MFAVWIKAPAVWVDVSEIETRAPDMVWVLPVLLRVMALDMSNTLPVELRAAPPLKVWE